MNTSEKNIFETLSFEILTSNEMNEIRGGGDIRPKSRDKDIYDEGDE